jgi:hypothetical protein
VEETESCPQNEPLLQGDVLKFEKQTPSHPFNLAVVINADCDMENRKHDGVIALLPIFRFTEYITKFWLPHFIDGAIKDASEQIKTLCLLDDKNIEELKRWIVSPQEESSFDKLMFLNRFNLDTKKSSQASDALDRLKNALISREGESLNALSSFAPKDSEVNHKKYIKSQVTSAFKGMGDGHFFITEVKGDDDIGFVVRMRRIYSVEADSCFKSHADYQALHTSQSSAAYRLCRLSPSYKFKLAQLFALQFSRIGLPNELTSLSSLAIDNATNSVEFNK